MIIPTDAMRAFAPLVGSWQSSGEVLDLTGRTTATISGTDSYEWMAGGGWLIHHVDVMVGDDHVVALELIGDHDAETDTFAMAAFDGSGTRSTMRARCDTDESWTLTGAGMRSTLVLAPQGSAMAAF